MQTSDLVIPSSKHHHLPTRFDRLHIHDASQHPAQSQARAVVLQASVKGSCPRLESMATTHQNDLRALEQTRQRLLQLTNALSSLQREIAVSDPLPNW